MKKKILLAMMVAAILSVFWGQHRIKEARLDRAEAFYAEAGFTPRLMKDHVKGIDLSKPVSVVSSERGTVYWQYQHHGGGQGSYYTLPKTSSSGLGIGQQGRDLKCYESVVDNTPILKSTAADIEDNWSGNTNEHAKGGAIQFFSACKKCFMEVECQE